MSGGPGRRSRIVFAAIVFGSLALLCSAGMVGVAAALGAPPASLALGAAMVAFLAVWLAMVLFRAQRQEARKARGPAVPPGDDQESGSRPIRARGK
jgi:membrane protein implicated in regulation of membrane protease activity